MVQIAISTKTYEEFLSQKPIHIPGKDWADILFGSMYEVLKAHKHYKINEVVEHGI